MKDLSAIKNQVIESQVREIMDAIGNEQLTLASESLIDFVGSYVPDEARQQNLQGQASKLKIRVRRLHKAVKMNLPAPESHDTVVSALIDLVTLARNSAELPQEVLHEEAVASRLAESLDENNREAARRGTKSTPEEMRKLLNSAMIDERGEEGFALRVRDVRLKYRGGDFELGPVSLDLKPGEITGVVGMNSSGKTTLLDIAVGRLAPSSGKLSYPSLEATPIPQRSIGARIGYVRQIPEAWSGRLRNNLNFTAAAFGMTGKKNERLVDLFVTRYGLSDHEDKSWSSISGGFKTRFELVRTLVTRPDILVLDEPLAYLDIVTQHIFLHDLRKIAQSHTRPMPILITSQHLHEIEGIADNMVILDDGKCIFSGAVSELRKTSRDAIYEVAIEAPEREVLEKLTPLGLHRYEPTALGAILFFDYDKTPMEVRASLVQSFGERLTYFRDISHSARRLFRNTREDFETGGDPVRMQV